MTDILFQIWRWVMQPRVWRFVGFASALVGLLCYALSSSFNYLFGNWNLWKILIYTVFSFIICMVILFAKSLQHSRSLRLKAHTAFFVLAITSLYSFFFDKVVNGKPDAYSLISCASFAIMSLSLSRQTQCGFEIDLLYFFLGCLIVQLMKIKLQLFLVGAGFSYSLIILRSSFSSIDAGVNNQYSHLQDGNSVILSIDSLHLTSASNNSSVNSQQLVITTGISSMMEQLQTFVSALSHENSNFIQMLLEHVKNYVGEYSELRVTDSNYLMDALKQETIKGLEETSKVMMTAGFEKDFSDVYNNCRRECLNNCLMHRSFALHKFSMDQVHNMPWKDLEDEIERWIRAFNVALKIIFPSERQLCNRIFFGFSSAADFSFTEICSESTVQLLSFADFVATKIPSPECLFKLLQVFEMLRDVIPEVESLFCDQYSVFLKNEVITIWKKFGKAIRSIFIELEYLIGRDRTKVMDLGGGLDPITQHVMNYLSVVCRSRQTLEQVFDDSSFSRKMCKIMDILENNLEAKSHCYEDPSLGYLFLMNNNTYIVEMTKYNQLGKLLGDDWFGKHTRKVWHYQGQYQKTMGTSISPTLVQHYFQPKSYGSPVEVSVGYKVYEGFVQDEIEALPSQTGERKKKETVKEIRTIVIASAAQYGNTYNMPPNDGFTWRKYGKKEILGFKYQRSYYRCITKKFHVCRAMKSVQQLDDNPNVFEVRYNGGHSCRICLTIPSLFVPARQQVNISKDMTQTIMSPLSTSYSGWLSSETPAKCISSIPDAKLDAPTDGGYHPMLDNVVGCLVSSLRSKQIMVVNEGGPFSLSAQTEETMELLDSILASKSEKYVDPALRHFFMMNNWRYLEVINPRKELDEISGNLWFQKSREKVQQNFELYQRNSWDKVLDFLKLDTNDSMKISLAGDLMKVKLSLFNMHFKEICRVQCMWSVHDEKIRKEIIASLKNILMSAYGFFIGKFQDIVKNNAYEYIEYGMFDIQDVLDNLFLGNKKDNSFSL